jgi:hypothetical protein
VRRVLAMVFVAVVVCFSTAALAGDEFSIVNIHSVPGRGDIEILVLEPSGFDRDDARRILSERFPEELRGKQTVEVA